MKKRVGNVILTSMMLLFSIIFCLGSLYWFFLINQNNDQLEPIQNKDIEPLIEEPETVENFTVTEAITDLKRDGCTIVSVKAQVYLNDPQYVNYKEFKSIALKNQIVVVSPSSSGTFLLVQKESVQWVWIPSKFT